MIHEPAIDELANKFGSKYALCVVAAKRARQIVEHAQNLGLTDNSNAQKPLTAAAIEISEGKISATKD